MLIHTWNMNTNLDYFGVAKGNLIKPVRSWRGAICNK